MNEQTFEKLQYNELMMKVERFCISGFGRRLLRQQRPTSHMATVKKRLQETSEARAILDATSHVPFIGVSDMETIIGKLQRGIQLEATELEAVAEFLRGARKLKRFMLEHEFFAPLLSAYAAGMGEWRTLEEDITQAIRAGQVVDEASKELKRIRKQVDILEGRIEERLTKFLKSAANREMIQDGFVTKKQDRFTIPIKASYKHKVAGTIVDTSNRGTTVFIEPEAIAKLNAELVVKRTEEAVEVYQVLATLTGAVTEVLPDIESTLDVIAQYDMVFAKGKYSQSIDGVTPHVNVSGRIRLKQVRHPLLESAVPLDFAIGTDYRGLIITGPNAGGKTVVLKTIGLLSLMTMTGLHIPAHTDTVISTFDEVFVDIGDNQDLESALSTFSAHMYNVANIMQTAGKRSLLLFDEIGSGTEPNEGAALAIAILEAAYKRGAIVVASTHYGEIKSYSEAHPDFMNAAMQFDPETLEPKYRLLMGQSGDSNALFIARKMKLPESILKQASRYMNEKTYDMTKVDDSKITREVEMVPLEEAEHFEKGDRVRLLETNQVGLVYSFDASRRHVRVFVDAEYVELPSRRVRLEARATELYPADYDLDTLFTTYQERKEAHDFARGSKKALRRVEKEIRERKKQEQSNRK
ncbi:DNA mismatch repair protein MutS domain protein [Exiguobacterium sp. AT1b]|uniref:DNA mismatch repair protein MutS domain protein n=1 Tax=Exiguobacterium sp. (strain ATCC BAA-1283 / AT1b) TaxID=360911 RepID=C4L0D5_EXISA|nr:mannonate oxidoreductase [Exiguobacterium sp. AT1b]ACQ70798.1 DNA mismatch repair protein MutS domain protein [Exiguobacterium sp. AT1b]